MLFSQFSANHTWWFNCLSGSSEWVATGTESCANTMWWVYYTAGHFTFCISLSLRPKTETKRLNLGLSPDFGLTDHCITYHCSLHNVIADISVYLCLFTNWQKSEVIFVHQNLISNWLTYLVYAKSTGELISFGFSNRSVRSLVSAKRSANRWVQTKKRLHFLGFFGLSPNLGLSEMLSDRLIQKVTHCHDCAH